MDKQTSYQNYRMEFVIFAVECAAKKAEIPADELYRRLDKQNLIQNLLFDCYDTLHTQGREYIADFVLEALHNWEEFAQKEKIV